jgi:hypothetical protein
MAVFSMRQHGPSSINPPTLDLVPIGPKVKRPRPKFVTPGQHWDYDQVDADEYDYEEPGWGLADLDETMDRLTPKQHARVLAKVDQLDDATDSAIAGLIDEEYSNALQDAIAAEITPTPPAIEEPPERIYSAILDTLLRQQARGYAVTQQQFQTLWRLAPQVQR